MSTEEKHRELDELRARVLRLEQEMNLAAAASAEREWPIKGRYTAYYATTGFLLGGLAAMSSLVFNIIGSLLFDKNPLELIRVYLTFPMGQQALDYDALDNGLILAVGCCLYVATGMLYGIVFQLALNLFTARSGVVARLIVASALALAVWAVNFYGVLSWLQPLLFHGRWIVELVPWWVGASTHLIFGWTMAILYPLGRFTPYRLETMTS